MPLNLQRYPNLFILDLRDEKMNIVYAKEIYELGFEKIYIATSTVSIALKNLVSLVTEIIEEEVSIYLKIAAKGLQNLLHELFQFLLICFCTSKTSKYFSTKKILPVAASNNFV